MLWLEFRRMRWVFRVIRLHAHRHNKYNRLFNGRESRKFNQNIDVSPRKKYTKTVQSKRIMFPLN